MKLPKLPTIVLQTEVHEVLRLATKLEDWALSDEPLWGFHLGLCSACVNSTLYDVLNQYEVLPTKIEMFGSWEFTTGSFSYPVPASVGNREVSDAKEAYDLNTSPLWLRQDLALHIANCIRENYDDDIRNLAASSGEPATGS